MDRISPSEGGDASSILAERTMIKAVFFDIGGVVAISWKKGPFEMMVERAAKLLHIPRKNVDAYFKSGIIRKLDEDKITELQFWKRLCKKHSIPCPPQKLLRPILRVRAMRIVPEFGKIARALRTQGVIAGAISNAIKAHAEIGRKTGTYQFFDPVILSCDIGVRKPKTKIFRIAVKKAGVRMSESIFFDDHQHNIDAANKLGMHAYLYKNLKQMRIALLKHGIWV